ncbi:Hypothetical predicted protein [Podarcis lilfordi]|uniref:Gamma-glutamylaminecyclotransferase n=1 Tax=Podarcis lilfordi TaxID=74358 RepID=A0AA35P3S5_9SAUR|nr:Hypothetical predicted protein [Podarcis lilfordi]
MDRSLEVSNPTRIKARGSLVRRKSGKSVLKGNGALRKRPEQVCVIGKRTRTRALNTAVQTGSSFRQRHGTGHRVTGEIYAVNDQMLQFLDEFESCPDMYQRTPGKQRLKLEAQNFEICQQGRRQILKKTARKQFLSKLNLDVGTCCVGH